MDAPKQTYRLSTTLPRDVADTIRAAGRSERRSLIAQCQFVLERYAADQAQRRSDEVAA